MNIIKYDGNSLKCPLCNSNFLIIDETRDETYCHDCGLVVKDNSLVTPSQIEFLSNLEEKTNKTFILDSGNK